MVKHEESVFSTRTQTLLTLNSAMVVILVGILTFQGKQAGPAALWVPLASICGMGVLLCLLWTILIMRAKGMNDHLVEHMKYIENEHLREIENLRKYDELFDPASPGLPSYLRRFSGTKTVVFRGKEGYLEKSGLPTWGSWLRMYEIQLILAGIFVALWGILMAWVLSQP